MNFERKLSLAPLTKLNPHLLILNLIGLSGDQESLKLGLGGELLINPKLFHVEALNPT